jgi:hypothetical protein
MNGVPNYLLLAESNMGGVSVVPTSFQVRYSNYGFTEVEICGVIDKRFDAERIAQQELKRFSLLDLMDEVSRRIKTGENKTEKMIRKAKA